MAKPATITEQAATELDARHVDEHRAVNQSRAWTLLPLGNRSFHEHDLLEVRRSYQLYVAISDPHASCEYHAMPPMGQFDEEQTDVFTIYCQPGSQFRLAAQNSFYARGLAVGIRLNVRQPQPAIVSSDVDPGQPPLEDSLIHAHLKFPATLGQGFCTVAGQQTRTVHLHSDDPEGVTFCHVVCAPVAETGHPPAAWFRTNVEDGPAVRKELLSNPSYVNIETDTPAGAEANRRLKSVKNMVEPPTLLSELDILEAQRKSRLTLDPRHCHRYTIEFSNRRSDRFRNKLPTAPSASLDYLLDAMHQESLGRQVYIFGPPVQD